MTVYDPCPVALAEPSCPNRPIAARVSIRRSPTGPVVATIDSRADGQFRLAIPPGRYWLRPVSITGAAVRQPVATPVTVRPGQYTNVILHIDSGIR